MIYCLFNLFRLCRVPGRISAVFRLLSLDVLLLLGDGGQANDRPQSCSGPNRVAFHGAFISLMPTSTPSQGHRPSKGHCLPL